MNVVTVLELNFLAVYSVFNSETNETIECHFNPLTASRFETNIWTHFSGEPLRAFGFDPCAWFLLMLAGGGPSLCI